MFAATKGRLDTIEYLLSKKVKIDVKNILGETALIIAAENGYLSVVKTLANSGAQKTKRKEQIACVARFDKLLGKILFR